MQQETVSLTSYEREVKERREKYNMKQKMIAEGVVPDGYIKCSCVSAIVPSKECDCAW